MPECVERIRIKWCTSFTLLGIKFDQTLNRMDRNYDECFKKVKDELNSWRFRYLTVFGKITVIKTMCLPKFTHISTVIPSLSLTRINEIEKEFKRFINDNNPSVTDKMMLCMSHKSGGLGMTKIGNLWRSIRFLWLKRLPFSNSTWVQLHN